MRWSATSGAAVGRIVGAEKVAGGEDGAVGVLVPNPTGVIGKMVGVEAALWGTWQARMPRMSRIMALAMWKRCGRIMQLGERSAGKHAVHDEK